MIRSIQLTEDGSHTVLCHDTGESFHSDQGAVMESMHVFIENGLKHVSIQTDPLRIFEVGFGTGLNALLTFDQNALSNRKISYETVELYPIEKEVYVKLNFSSKINSDQRNILQELHNSEWEIEHAFGNFNFQKHRISLLDFIPNKKFHLIYFDAFSPDNQLDLWSLEVFKKLYEHTEPGGILVTYCAKGVVRRTLQAVGFTVERLTGAGRKREMIRATKLTN